METLQIAAFKQSVNERAVNINDCHKQYSNVINENAIYYTLKYITS